MSDLPAVVDGAWLQAHLDDGELFVGDVRGPNAHARGHVPGSKPLVLGSPPPMSDRETVEALAVEIGLRLRRHGVTGSERLVLYDRGDGVGAMPSAQLAELAGHPRVAVLVGGIAGWPGELHTGTVELDKNKAMFTPNLAALPTRDELAGRLNDPTLVILDVRSEAEYAGFGGYPCDPRQGHIPGAAWLEYSRLYAGPGQPESRGRIGELLALPHGAEVVPYCHSGSRSALATLALRSVGYPARNYAGSWHEWSRHRELPLER